MEFATNLPAKVMVHSEDHRHLEGVSLCNFRATGYVAAPRSERVGDRDLSRAHRDKPSILHNAVRRLL
jgi:hypothetical protein